MIDNFKGSAVLVTGASRGIGKAVALAFAARGARIMVHYRSGKHEAEAVLKSLPGEGHLMLQADLDKPAEAMTLADEALKVTGKIAVLVNNAGIYHECNMLEVNPELWIKHWDDMYRTNLRAAAVLCYSVGRHMASAGSGKIISISSRGAFRGEPCSPAYAATKAGINQLTQSLARLLISKGVSCFAVAPGFVETEMSAAALLGPEAGSIRNQSPAGRVATTTEVAEAVMLLASSECLFMSGSIIDVNGASYMRS